MLKAFDTALLSPTPDGISSCFYACVEAYKSENGSGTDVKCFAIETPDVENWSRRRGPYSRQKMPFAIDQQNGGIRILLAQPHSIQKRAIPEDLIRMKLHEALDLPSNTLTSFQLASGIVSMQLSPPGSTIQTCDRLGLVMRTPQKVECCTGGLALSYDFATATTTAFILGYAFDLDNLLGTSSPLTDILQQLRECYDDWDKPLTLATVFLVHHAIMVQAFVVGPLSEDVVYPEYCIGVTGAGRSGVILHDAPKKHWQLEQHRLYVNGHMHRDHAKELISMLNNLSKALIFTGRSPEWDMTCANFLLRLLADHQRLRECRGTSVQALRDVLDYVLTYSETSAEVVGTSRARVQLQLNILYTAIAQDDGQTSARLAASAGKDSTSMKILAVITAIYLPGTFVATLFSMGMFDWQNGSTGRVADAFWIYWIVAIPLTVITLAGWAWWWKLEKARFEQEVRLAVQQEESRTRARSVLRKFNLDAKGSVMA